MLLKYLEVLKGDLGSVIQYLKSNSLKYSIEETEHTYIFTNFNVTSRSRNSYWEVGSIDAFIKTATFPVLFVQFSWAYHAITPNLGFTTTATAKKPDIDWVEQKELRALWQLEQIIGEIP